MARLYWFLHLNPVSDNSIVAISHFYKNIVTLFVTYCSNFGYKVE